ncbi:MAG: DNA alkylation repair protein [Ruminococcaceae bacterium]|nr:DNA alkylation repair protein [Oscillospiraceae bacterium]
MKKTLPEEIRDCLLSMQDKKYRDFHSALMPTVDKDLIIGVRMPLLRTFGKELYKTGNYEEFLGTLPHYYYEENNLHGILIEKEKDFEKCISRLDAFLPYVDNWATCDLMNPKIFVKNKDRLITHIDRWMASTHPYTVRFGIKMLMTYFLGDDYREEYALRVAKIKSDEYYVKMMCAWYFATALAANFEDALPFIKERKLEAWVHNKTIQKSKESFRLTSEQKNILSKLKL